MTKVFSTKHIVTFIAGFIIGKLLGATVSMLPLWGLIFEDPDLSGLVIEELVSQTLSFNLYHLTLAIIGGLVLVVWFEAVRLENEWIIKQVRVFQVSGGT